MEKNIDNYLGVFLFFNFKKTKLFLALFGCLLFVQTNKAQSNPVEFNTYVRENKLEGVWFFEKAEFKSFRYGDDNGIPVEIKTIEQLDDLNTVDFPFETVFREIEISGGSIVCTIGAFGNNPFYLDNNLLSLIKQVEIVEERELPLSIPIQPYSYAVKGDALIFTFDFPFGDSRYDFPLWGKLVITLNKQS
ncbi:MAG: hypothetical protein LBP83_06900 [Dysgonamonadaceae bacterium]|jgi:hypothetical protein|nr:hypothetical protein [Dysgonamonadaceae bacterium]